MWRLYDYLPSGNGYKVRLLLTYLGLPFERVELDILKGETRTPDFLQKNLNGRIPVLEVEPGKFVAESNAILFYLAEGTPFLQATAGQGPFGKMMISLSRLRERKKRPCACL